MKSALKELVNDATGKIELYKAPRKAVSIVYRNPCSSNNCNRSLNVAIVATPCHGFGDVIFATKFARYIRWGLTPRSQGYSNNVSIITPTPQMFEQLGVNDIDIIPLESNSYKQCRRLGSYRRPENVAPLDLIFIAPLVVDFEINYRDVKKLFQESTPFNTIFLSEYQDKLDKNFDFPTGVGKGFYGLLFDGAKPAPKLSILGNIPYALAYLAQDVGIKYCLLNFVEMVIAKYHKKYPDLQIVMPEWGALELSKSAKYKKFAKKYYPNSTLYTKSVSQDTIFETPGKKGLLVIRGDVLPVPRTEMLSLIKYSIPDILMTGDQSITDTIDCCQHKNIWYQTVPWKRDFAKALSTELPQRYLGKESTSCGSLHAVKWNMKNRNFKSLHDFRKKAKHELDAIFRAASEAANPDSLIYKYLKQLETTSSKKLLTTF